MGGVKSQDVTETSHKHMIASIGGLDMLGHVFESYLDDLFGKDPTLIENNYLLIVV